jgi:hypothetical protein
MKKTLPSHLSLRLQYRPDPTHVPSLEEDLGRLFQFRQVLGELSPHLREWWLGGDTVEEASLYPAFDIRGPTTQLVAVLRERERVRMKGDPTVGRTIGVWNGQQGSNGASFGMAFVDGHGPGTMRFSTYCADALIPKATLRIAQAMIEIWQPLFLTSAPIYYEKVFKDRPGVGGLLYLPRVLAAYQVPEARELVPVLNAEKKQVGTIIISVTDEPFSELSPAHVQIANAIEIRLVDQDLLPRFVDL